MKVTARPRYSFLIAVIDGAYLEEEEEQDLSHPQSTCRAASINPVEIRTDRDSGIMYEIITA